MQPAGSLDELLADPFGRYLSGRTFIYFYPEKSLNGFLIWGRPDEDDIRRLTRALDAEMHDDATPHLSYVDLRRLEGVDTAAFGVLGDYVRSRSDAFREIVRKQALVRPPGFSGAVVSGFFSVVGAPYPVEVFPEPAEALEWLGYDGEALVRELSSLYEIAAGTPPVLQALREVLAAKLSGADLTSCAKVLGLSERTLQRRLNEAGTTFQAELNAAQVRSAKALLLDTDAKLTAVALEVGCASLQHFSALFRKHTGESPSSWRSKHRRA